ncbi:recombinase family protein [Oceanobacillus senegalensis]|uniref:recombinase family protein n=1 Tax=Oceanobacillus senegalensis TaxID=1936063 RepID=UPI000A30C6B5|nr:recombinase family protein [Oceanobacillus senegalensis]
MKKNTLVYSIRPLESGVIRRRDAVIRRYSEQYQLHIIRTYSDIGYPASNLKRPALNEMVKYLSETSESIDTILFFAMERFEKDLRRIDYFMPRLKKHVNHILFVQDYQGALVEEVETLDHGRSYKSS